jgi:hypothetical protein
MQSHLLIEAEYVYRRFERERELAAVAAARLLPARGHRFAALLLRLRARVRSLATLSLPTSCARSTAMALGKGDCIGVS